MQPITYEDLQMFKERSRTELRSNCDVSRLAWDNVVPALCAEVFGDGEWEVKNEGGES